MTTIGRLTREATADKERSRKELNVLQMKGIKNWKGPKILKVKQDNSNKEQFFKSLILILLANYLQIKKQL